MDAGLAVLLTNEDHCPGTTEHDVGRHTCGHEYQKSEDEPDGIPLVALACEAVSLVYPVDCRQTGG